MHSNTLLFIVEPTSQGWTVSFCHEPNGQYDRRVDAMRSAISDARRVNHLGHHVTVAVRRPPDRSAPPARTIRLGA